MSELWDADFGTSNFSTSNIRDMPVMKFYYRNWKGIEGYRRIVDPKITYKESKYHKGQQFIIEGFDLDKQDFREYAMVDIIEYIREVK